MFGRNVKAITPNFCRVNQGRFKFGHELPKMVPEPPPWFCEGPCPDVFDSGANLFKTEPEAAPIDVRHASTVSFSALLRVFVFDHHHVRPNSPADKICGIIAVNPRSPESP
jgi:hypothetical protein